jgi:hypothetical protein
MTLQGLSPRDWYYSKDWQMLEEDIQTTVTSTVVNCSVALCGLFGDGGVTEMEYHWTFVASISTWTGNGGTRQQGLSPWDLYYCMDLLVLEEEN